MDVLGVFGRGIVRALALLVLWLIRVRRVIFVGAGLVVAAWLVTLSVPRLPILSSFQSMFGQVSPTTQTGTRAANRPVGITGEPVASVDAYIKGLTEFDAQLMWGSLAEEAINQMKSRGGSLDALQSGLDDAKKRGARYEDISMIGNYPLQDGRRYLFYVLSRRGFSGPDQLEQIFFVFTVSRDGKITRID
ncbi:MAG: hypothetical protein EPO26_12995 [Chloroflexota bacterium]|nr:MAG: hypothetical protein EPO26_12995 [Chloroflexota bacterium]